MSAFIFKAENAGSSFSKLLVTTTYMKTRCCNAEDHDLKTQVSCYLSSDVLLEALVDWINEYPDLQGPNQHGFTLYMINLLNLRVLTLCNK
jgi:hypothetical protein